MRVTVDLECETPSSFRTDQVRGMFDLPSEPRSRRQFDVELPGFDEPWRIGAIVGPSGSGKSSVARRAWPESYWIEPEWPSDRAVIDRFDDLGLSIRALTAALTAVGFSSPPAWLRPYRTLSRGEQFRCQLARALVDPRPLIVFDEFTSVVDRTVATIGSSAAAKSIRRREDGKRFVAVTCHYDVLAWLEPDWVLDMATQQLARGSLRRPPIELQVAACRRAAWELFAPHHYLSAGLPRGCRCWLATWSGRPIAFAAVQRHVGRHSHSPRRPPLFKIARLVVLPDFQGVGIGSALMRALGEAHAAAGQRLGVTTSHPAMIRACSASPHWKLVEVRRPGNRRHDKSMPVFQKTRAVRRQTCSFQWRTHPSPRSMAHSR